MTSSESPASLPNILKVKKMCELIREHQPQATIVIGGHIATIPDLEEQLDVDHVVRGEGVRWFREFLGEDPNRPYNHPLITSGFGTRNAGLELDTKPEHIAATLIPSVGCPLGCNFCSTSALFGGKGNSINFYPTGDELFDVMEQIEQKMGVYSFFVMDENFLFYRKRAIRLLELMEKHNKAWLLHVFSSANALAKYSMDELVRLGIDWVWMGLEGKNSQYNKLNDTDTFELVKRLQDNGIRVLGSTIIGLEEHTPENIDEAIEHAVKHDTDFHQFMLYTPIPGTPLHRELSAKGVMKDPKSYHVGDIHGQLIFNYHHANIPDGDESEMIVRAFNRDFEVNGPSTARIVRTTLLGYRRFKNHPDARIRRRLKLYAYALPTAYAALIGASMRYYKKRDKKMYDKLSELSNELYREFGFKSWFYRTVGGLYLYKKLMREERFLENGGTYEPQTFYEHNSLAIEHNAKDGDPANYVAPRVVTQDTLPTIQPRGSVATPANRLHQIDSVEK